MDLQTWREFLQAWSHQMVEEILNNPDLALHFRLPSHVIESRWLGYPPATEGEIEATERHLGVWFPPSYRTFLQVSNGFRHVGNFHLRLWSADKIGWHYHRHPDLVDAWNEAAGVAETDEAGEDIILPHHFRATLEISDIGDEEVYLLNPEIQTPNGEWQAWFFASWLPGATQYPSFEAMMLGEYEKYETLQDYQEEPATYVGFQEAMETVTSYEDFFDRSIVGNLIEQFVQLGVAVVRSADPTMRPYYEGMEAAYLLAADKLKRIASLQLTGDFLKKALQTMADEMEAERTLAQMRPSDAKSMKDLLRGQVAQRQGGHAEGCRIVVMRVKQVLASLG
ncbi:MAG: SMI1/KNR4 family protein [Anaerolineae bacterium]|nr:SMI1/KNR4 family protein [Anaerolineae bacterium]